MERRDGAPARRISREKRTVFAMIEVYCSGNHEGQRPLCDACKTLYAYAAARIDRCPFHPAKPACNDCEIHCYRTGERDQIKQVMRFSGPRMMIRHPALALFHMIDRLQR